MVPLATSSREKSLPFHHTFRYGQSILEWADDEAEMSIVQTLIMAPTRTLKRNGSRRIGLCRTEHMFFKPDTRAMRQMLLARDDTTRKRALRKSSPFRGMDHGHFPSEMASL